MQILLRHEIELPGEEVIHYERTTQLPAQPIPGMEIIGKDFNFYIVDVVFHTNLYTYIATDYSTFDKSSNFDNYRDFIHKITREGFMKIETKEVEK